MEKSFDYYSNVKTGTVKWLWYPYIPYGKLTILQGDPGEGKSSFIIDVIARLSRGDVMPDGSGSKEVQPAIYQCAEDGLADTVKPRFEKAGADCSKIAYIVDSDASLNLDDASIEETIVRIGARLLVVDPLQAFIPPDADLTNVSRMRSVLRRIAGIAERYECAIVLVGHMNKKGSGKSLYRGLGSIDIAAIARSILMVVRNPEKPGIRYLIPIKSSLAQEGKTLSFSFDDKGKLVWDAVDEGNDIDNDLDDEVLLSFTKKDLAKQYLISLLEETPVPSTEVFDRLRTEGIQKRTANLAKKELGVIAYKVGKRWWWKLPDDVSLEEDDSDE